MYMLRAYQSPASGADCGPQCAQMPNLASRNHSGTWYFSSEPRVPSKGPLVISTPAGAAAARLTRIAGAADMRARAFLLARLIGATRVSGGRHPGGTQDWRSLAQASEF